MTFTYRKKTLITPRHLNWMVSQNTIRMYAADIQLFWTYLYLDQNNNLSIFHCMYLKCQKTPEKVILLSAWYLLYWHGIEIIYISICFLVKGAPNSRFPDMKKACVAINSGAWIKQYFYYYKHMYRVKLSTSLHVKNRVPYLICHFAVQPNRI